jgi:hypothetical protein
MNPILMEIHKKGFQTTNQSGFLSYCTIVLYPCADFELYHGFPLWNTPNHAFKRGGFNIGRLHNRALPLVEAPGKYRIMTHLWYVICQKGFKFKRVMFESECTICIHLRSDSNNDRNHYLICHNDAVIGHIPAFSGHLVSLSLLDLSPSLGSAQKFLSSPWPTDLLVESEIPRSLMRIESFLIK